MSPKTIVALLRIRHGLVTLHNLRATDLTHTRMEEALAGGAEQDELEWTTNAEPEIALIDALLADVPDDGGIVEDSGPADYTTWRAAYEDLLPKYTRLRNHVRLMFAEAARQGLYLGIGRSENHRDVRSEQEGPLTKKLRALVGLDQE